MANKSDKMPWKEAFKINVRAIKLLNSKNRLMFPYVTIKALLNTVFSYASLFVTARLIGELAGERRPETLLFWAAFQIISTAVFAIIHGVMYHAYEVKATNFWNNLERIEDEKFMSMDYSDVEDQRVRDLRDQIDQNRNWSGWGFSRIQWNFEGLLSNLFSVIGAFAMAAGLIINKVPEGSPYAFLNSPFAVLGFLAMMIFCASISPFLNGKSMEMSAALLSVCSDCS